jgi:hypothetical protein
MTHKGAACNYWPEPGTAATIRTNNIINHQYQISLNLFMTFIDVLCISHTCHTT